MFEFMRKFLSGWWWRLDHTVNAAYDLPLNCARQSGENDKPLCCAYLAHLKKNHQTKEFEINGATPEGEKK